MIQVLLQFARRKRQHLNRIGTLGFGVDISPTATFVGHSRIKLGNYCRIGPRCHIEAKGGVSIGDGTILAPGVVVLSSTHNYAQSRLLPYDEFDIARPVTIGRGVWIGYGAMLIPGVSVGDASVIAAGSVVTTDTAVGSIVGGNPARLLKSRDDIDCVSRLINENRYYLREKASGLQRLIKK